MHLLVFFFGTGVKSRTLWTLLPTHLQHYKQLILTPEQCGGRKRGKDSSEQHNDPLAQNTQLPHKNEEMFSSLHIQLLRWPNMLVKDRRLSVVEMNYQLDALLAARGKPELEIHA